MPRVPTAESLGLGTGPAKVVPLQGKLTVAAEPRDFGAAQAELIAKAGENIGKGGARLFRAQAAVEERDDRISATKDALADQDRWLTTMEQRQNAAEPGAPGFTESLLKDFDEDSQRTLEGVKPGIYRQVRSENLARLRVNLHEHAIGFESQARQAKRKSDLESTVSLGASTIYKNPESYPATLRTQVDLIESSALPPAAKAQAAQTLTHAFAEAHWRGRVDRDPRGTLGFLTSSEAIPGLEYQDLLALRDRAQSAVARLDAQDRSAAAERRQGVAGEARFATDMLEKGLPVAGLADLKLRAREFPDIAGPLAAAERTSGYARRFALLPPDQRELEVARLQATPQTPETFGQLQSAARILQADDEAARGKRLLGRGAELGLFELEPVDLTSGASLAGRVRVSRMASSHFGTTVGLLTPEERAREIETLGGLTGEQKAQRLAQLQTAAGPEVFGQLMGELGGTGGVDRQTRYLSLVVGRPEAAGLAGVVSEAIDSKPEDLKLGLVQQNATAAQLEADVVGRLREFLDTTGATYRLGGPGAATMQADIVDMVGRTAQVLMLRGVSYGDAIDRAAEALVNSRYEFRDTYRVPLPDANREAFLARLDKGLADTMAALSPALLDPPGSLRDVPEEIRRQVYYEHVRDSGTWVTLPDETGLLLSDETGAAVTVGGKPVIVKFGGVSDPGVTISDAVRGPGLARRLYPVVRALETGGHPNPEAATNPESSATGPMQVTAAAVRDVAGELGRPDLVNQSAEAIRAALLADPGFATLAGQRYLDRQLSEFRLPSLALAAYRSGPGQVRDWLARLGDPRVGGISEEAWLAAIPDEETRKYVQAGLRRLG